jgi:hypothetical protein
MHPNQELEANVNPSGFKMVRPRIWPPDEQSYRQLAEFWNGDLQRVDDGIWKASIVYQNLQREQRFNIAIHGRDPDCVRAFMNATKAYLEAAELEEGESPLIIESTDDNFELQDVEPQRPGLSDVSDLLITMDWLLPRDLSGWKRFFSGEIIIETERAAYEELLSLYDQHWQDVGVRRAALGMSPAFVEWFLAWLQDPSEHHPIFVPLSKYTTLHFAFDPPINNGQIHEYREHCNVVNAHVRIGLRQNSAMVTLQKIFPGSDTIGSRSERQPHWTGWIPGIKPEFAKFRGQQSVFDVTVTGLQDNSLYEIQGGWTLGSGCE